MLSIVGISEVALSEADGARQFTGTLAVSLDGLTVAFQGTSPNFGDAFGSVGAGGPAKGWAWIGGKMVYGTEADLARAAADYEAEQKRLAAPKPKRKVTKAKKLGELPRTEERIPVPVIDWLGGAPDMAAFQAQAEVGALVAKLKAAERDDEALLIDLVQEHDRQQVLAALALVERVL